MASCTSKCTPCESLDKSHLLSKDEIISEQYLTQSNEYKYCIETIREYWNHSASLVKRVFLDFPQEEKDENRYREYSNQNKKAPGSTEKNFGEQGLSLIEDDMRVYHPAHELVVKNISH